MAEAPRPPRHSLGLANYRSVYPALRRRLPACLLRQHVAPWLLDGEAVALVAGRLDGRLVRLDTVLHSTKKSPPENTVTTVLGSLAEAPWALAVSPCGTRVAASGGDSILLVDARTGTRIAERSTSRHVGALAWFGHSVVAAGGCAGVDLLDGSTLETRRVLRDAPSGVCALASSPSGEWLMVTTTSGRVRLVGTGLTMTRDVFTPAAGLKPPLTPLAAAVGGTLATVVAVADTSRVVAVDAATGGACLGLDLELEDGGPLAVAVSDAGDVAAAPLAERPPLSVGARRRRPYDEGCGTSPEEPTVVTVARLSGQTRGTSSTRLARFEAPARVDALAFVGHRVLAVACHVARLGAVVRLAAPVASHDLLSWEPILDVRLGGATCCSSGGVAPRRSEGSAEDHLVQETHDDDGGPVVSLVECAPRGAFEEVDTPRSLL